MTHITKAKHQRGFTLIEAMVALLVAALGVLGILGMQMRTLADTQTSVRRAQAVRLIEDLGERMRVNVNALHSIADYVSGFDDGPDSGHLSACIGAGSSCDQSSLAQHDLAVWKKSVEDNLPLGKAAIYDVASEAANNKRLLGVVIAWRENERYDADEDYKSSMDATKIRDAEGNLVDGIKDANSQCPEEFVCHWQYIPVAARCAPYSGSGGATKYYCR